MRRTCPAIGIVLLAMAGGYSAVVDDLKQVSGMDLYRGPESGKELLRENGFCVVPQYYHQIFGPYLKQGDMFDQKPDLPPFVTADCVFRTFHSVFEEELQQVESYAHGKMTACAAAMLIALGPRPTEGDTLVWDYFQVARCLLEDVPAPADTPGVARELETIVAEAGISVSPLFGYEMDYSQFKPRGFYTKTKELGDYFRAMTWFGCAAFRIKSERETAAAMRIAETFAACEDARAVWNSLDTLYRQLLSHCDDLTVAEYADFLKELPKESAGSERLSAFTERAKQARDPQFNDMVLTPGQMRDWVTESKGMRFMGRRYLPDGGVMAAVTDPALKGRYFPSGLDVLAANGSARARAHAAEKEGGMPGYLDALDQAGKKLAEEKQAAQPSSYMRMLRAMEALNAPPIAEAAPFAKTDAYADKNLMTASAMWASGRHAWQLHSKQLMVARCMFPVKDLAGYIEPNPAFFEEMLALVKSTEAILSGVPTVTSERFSNIASFIDKLSQLHAKQLKGECYTPEECRFFTRFGERLSELQGNVMNPVDDGAMPWMAMAADVATEAQSQQCLEVAAGGAMPIYAVVPYAGQLHLVRGGVYSYFEFWQPIAERLTDDEWLKKWVHGDMMPPEWTSTFITAPLTEADAPKVDIERLILCLRYGLKPPQGKIPESKELNYFLKTALEGNTYCYCAACLIGLAMERIPDVAEPLILRILANGPDESLRQYYNRITDSRFRHSKEKWENGGGEETYISLCGTMGYAYKEHISDDILKQLSTMMDTGERAFVEGAYLFSEECILPQVQELWVKAFYDTLKRDWYSKMYQISPWNKISLYAAKDVAIPCFLDAFYEVNRKKRRFAVRCLGRIYDNRFEDMSRFPSTASAQELSKMDSDVRMLLAKYLSSPREVFREDDSFFYDVEDLIRFAYDINLENRTELLIQYCSRNPEQLLRTYHIPITQLGPLLCGVWDEIPMLNKSLFLSGWIDESHKKALDREDIPFLRFLLNDTRAIEYGDERRFCDVAVDALNARYKLAPPEIPQGATKEEMERIYDEQRKKLLEMNKE